MATLREPVGYECEFVDQVPEDYFCKLCKHVARESNLITCCSEILCKACVDDIIQNKKTCPGCQETELTSVKHVKFERKILALEVHCTMKDRGCPWIGQLQHLDAHLDVITGGCQYADVECPRKCNQKVQKRNVDIHLAGECQNRNYQCPHCNFSNKFCVVSQHFDVCPYYPLACPNKCGANFERDDLGDHMKMCGLEEVQCVFSDAGCQAKFIRDNQDEHMNQNIQKHLALMPACTLRIERKLQEQQEMFEKKIAQKDEQIEQVEQKLDKKSQEFEQKLKEKVVQIKVLEEQLNTNGQVIEQQQQTIRQICGEVGILPYDIILTNYQQRKEEDGFVIPPPMYTHPMGYRFTLRIYPNGFNGGASTHLSVVVYSLKSDHDAALKFPVKFTITLQLLNQHNDQNHYTRDIQCKITTKGITHVHIGYGWIFIPQAALDWNSVEHTQYLKDDCLKFRIAKIVVY